jgi:hypothetical protein
MRICNITIPVLPWTYLKNEADKQIKGWLKVRSSCLLYHLRLPNWEVLPVLHTILQIRSTHYSQEDAKSIVD